jgi:hypothetical protein
VNGRRRQGGAAAQFGQTQRPMLFVEGPRLRKTRAVTDSPDDVALSITGPFLPLSGRSVYCSDYARPTVIFMLTSPTVTTTVGIVGAGPAGLMLAHLLRLDGIDSVTIDSRSRAEIESTHRAGILERDSVRLLVESGVSDRVLREGHEHRGINLRFGGESHRIDFQDLVGASTWLYPQTDVFTDLADAAQRDGGDVRIRRDRPPTDQLHRRGRDPADHRLPISGGS